MLRITDSQNKKMRHTCQICPNNKIFNSSIEFSKHLRGVHCSKEGGSFVCRYGKHGVCPSLPVEGVSDKDYEAHVQKKHVRGDEGNRSDTVPPHTPPHDDCMVYRPHIPPIEFKDENFTVYSCTQNISSVLNDPSVPHKKQADFFTKTWGEEFVPCKVTSLTLLPNIPKVYFDDYLKKVGFGLKIHQRLKKSLPSSASPAQPGDTGFSQAAAAAARRQIDKANSNIELIPKVFMQSNFALEDPDTFNAVLPWSQIDNVKERLDEKPGNITSHFSMPRNSAKLLQEKLTYYLDIAEVNLAQQIALRSEDFFSAMTSQDQLQDHVRETCSEITHLRLKVKKVEEVLTHKSLQILRHSSLRTKYVSVHNKLKLMAAVQQTQPTIQLLLSTSDFVGALDLIATTQEVLQQELAGIQSFRHLGSQLAEMERVIERMMETDFVDFATAYLTSIDDEEDDEMEGILVDEDRLVSLLFGLLRKRKFQFLHLYRDEAYSTLKSIIKQTVYGIVTETDTDEESQSLADAMRGLNFQEWLALLDKVFNSSLKLLKKMKVMHKSMVGVLVIAAGCKLPQDGTDNETVTPTSRRDELDILISDQDFVRLTTESKELLCSACELAQVRCAKLIHVRSKAGCLDNLMSAEFVSLARQVEGFVTDCERICGRQSHSLRGTLLSQAKKFVERFHDERKQKLSLILDNERWKQTDIPAELQKLVDSLVDGVKPVFRIMKNPTVPSTETGRSSTHLVVNGDRFAVVGTVLLLLKMIVEYCQCVEDTPMLVTDIMSKLFEIIKMFNSRTCQLVLGAGALQVVGLKTITAKHLALAARCLEVVMLHIPTFRDHFESKLPAKQYILLTQFDQILKDYANHRTEIFSKLVNLMEELITDQFSRWEVRPPMPSQAMRGTVKQFIKLHESLSSILSPSQVQTIFKDIRKVFKNCIAQKLEKLGVQNNGGPQHGLVTSDLTFFCESLKSYNGLEDLSKGLEEVWKIVHELKLNKTASSPNTNRKGLPQR